jgi:hypothetical protein
MATAAAAANAKARRDVQHHFFSNDAVRPDSAVPFDPASRLQRKQFERMRSVGIVHEAKPGQYWMDVVAYDIDLRRRFTLVRTILLTMVVVLLIGLSVSLLVR